MSNNISDIPEITSRAEARYITKRKMKAMLNSICFYICRIFPIKNDLISVCTFEGKGGFGCNPKYIIAELHQRRPELNIVWIVNDMSKEFPDYIKKVPNTIWSRAYWLSISKVWIDNYRKPYGTKKRKGQYYINTWHGMVGFKTIGLWRGAAFSRMAYIVSKNDSDMADIFLSDSRFCTDFFPKGLVFDGDILEVGAPRCDILIKKGEAIRRDFRKRHDLADDCKCVMFAPTFRESSSSGKRAVFSENWSLDFERLLYNLSLKMGGEWCLCLRLHPQLAKEISEIPNVKTVNISKEDDMYENLAAMDVLITDYSSCAMDAELMHIPVFIYADDVDQYKSDRGSFVWEMDEKTRAYPLINKTIMPHMNAVLPFTIAHNNDELEEDIKEYNKEDYLRKLDEYEKEIGVITDGAAAGRVVDKILSIIRDKNGERE